MPTTSLFSGVVRAVTRELKRGGFAAKAGTFSRELETGNTIALAIQRSVKSTPDEVLVTVNYWVFSSRLAGKLGEDRTSARDYSKAHWRKRLAEDGKEQWIAVRSPDAGAALVIDAIGRTLPDLMEHSTDAALRDEWQVGRGPGLGRMQRLLYLAILLNELGPTERIPAVLAELRKAVAGGPHERLVEMRLEQAGVSS